MYGNVLVPLCTPLPSNVGSQSKWRCCSINQAVLTLLPWLLHIQVIAVGSDVSIKVSAGDKVVFNKYAMAEVEVADGNILFVAEKSILATLE